MTRAKLAILLLVALAFAAPALARPDQAETVSIRIMPPGGICGGVCPWFEASLDGQGLVTVRDLAFGDADSLTHSFQYVAPTRGAAGFRTVLLPLRPAWGPREQTDWLSRRLASTNNLEIVITWRSGDRIARFAISHGDRDNYALVRQALAAVGLNERGTRGRLPL